MGDGFKMLTIAGEAPHAMTEFAIKSIETKFVIAWTKGFLALTAASAAATFSGFSKLDIGELIKTHPRIIMSNPSPTLKSPPTPNVDQFSGELLGPSPMHA